MNWSLTKNVLPDEGIVVETISEGGQQVKLKRQGRLWFYPDGSMYVYYTPSMWKPAQWKDTP